MTDAVEKVLDRKTIPLGGGFFELFTALSRRSPLRAAALTAFV
jgi:hypothetical protein